MINMEEIWKDIQGYEQLYQISTLGNVKSLNYNNTGKEKLLKPSKITDNYLQVSLHKQGKRKMYLVHRLVALHFIPNPNNLSEINHRDEDPSNNVISNLEWCDRKYNNNYGTRTEKSTKSNTNHPNKSKQVMCVETGVVYPSTMEIQRQLGFAHSHISKCCTGKKKQAYNYTWKYV